MDNFKQNIISIYKEKGQIWLNNLPQLVKTVATTWNLTDLQPISNLSYHYVLTGWQNKEPIVLKLYPDPSVLIQENSALEAFSKNGAVKIIDRLDTALLLERAVPGISLKDYFPHKDREATKIICQIISKLHLAPITQSNNFIPLKKLLAPIDNNWLQIPLSYLEKARELKQYLLETSGLPLLLHGDLHHENILSNKNGWVVIDPKGFIGETTYETTAFIRNPIPELLKDSNSAKIILDRIALSAELLNLDKERIRSWCFVQSILSHIWNLEDNINPRYFIELTRIFNKLI